MTTYTTQTHPTRFIATFGVNSKNADRYVIVNAPNEEAAIQKMNQEYDGNWSQLYATEEGAGVTRFGLKFLKELE